MKIKIAVRLSEHLQLVYIIVCRRIHKLWGGGKN